MRDFIVDSHCHLDLIAQKDLDIDQVIRDANDLNVKILQTISTRVSKIDEILFYTRKYDNVYASIGNHPCNVEDEEMITSTRLVELINQNSKIIGIGETGLDYYHDLSPIERQKESFYHHINAAKETGLPVIIHSRNADSDMINILDETQKQKQYPALMHCFSSSEELARTALDLDVLISISGIVTFKNARELQDIVKFIPLESLLVETDSPYLAPTPHRGKINQPGYTKYVVDFIADIKGLSAQDVAKQTTENFYRIFKRL